MNFDFFSLWFVYWPVSAIMWFWHKVLGSVLGEDNGFAWALSVLLLVFTLRALLIKPFVGQVRSMRKMQEFQPQIKKLQEKYKGDRQKLAEEMQKLQKEHGVNPLGGCLPVLVQVPVFIGLFHVLRGFQPNYPFNYVFNANEIHSFLSAKLFGVNLSEAIFGGLQELGHFTLNFSNFQAHVIPVALPLMLVASVATHFTARVSQQHQSATTAANPQAAIMGKLTMWLFPIGILVFGAFFPIAILLYWLSNNSWTLTQQFLVYRKIAAEEAEKKELAREQRDQLAPRPGQKPQRARAAVEPVDATADTADTADSVDTSDGSDTADEPQDAPSGATAVEPVDAPAAGHRAPGKVGGGKNGAKNGAPGKVGTNGSSANGNGAGGNGSGKAGGSGRPAPGKVSGGPGKAGSGSGKTGGNGKAAAGSGRPGNKKPNKKRR